MLSDPPAPTGDGRLGWALVLAGSLVIALLMTPFVISLAEGHQRDKQLRTMSDLRRLGRALDAYSMDHRAYPRSDDGTVGGLAQVLVPTYLQALPAVDGWQNPLRYEDGTYRTWEGLELPDYRIESYGKDGRDSGPASGVVTSFDHDIVFSTGTFIAYPDVLEGS